MEFVVVKIFNKMKYYRKMTFMNETRKKIKMKMKMLIMNQRMNITV